MVCQAPARPLRLRSHARHGTMACGEAGQGWAHAGIFLVGWDGHGWTRKVMETGSETTRFFFRPQKDPPLPMKEAFWSQPKIGVSLQLRGSKLKIFENTTR